MSLIESHSETQNPKESLIMLLNPHEPNSNTLMLSVSIPFADLDKTAEENPFEFGDRDCIDVVLSEQHYRIYPNGEVEENPDGDYGERLSDENKVAKKIKNDAFKLMSEFKETWPEISTQSDQAIQAALKIVAPKPTPPQ